TIVPARAGGGRSGGGETKRGRVSRRGPRVWNETRLLDVLVDQFGHLEHRDLALAAEHGLELVVCVDHATLFRILKPVLLDVAPELLRDLGARHRASTDDGSERRIRLLRRHERRIRRSLLRLLGRSLLRAALLRSLFGALLGRLLPTLLCSHSLSR